MKKQINLFKIVMFIVVVGMFFLLPLCACQRKTTTTEKITTTEKTTKKLKNPFDDFYYQGNSKVIEYEFKKENDKIIWKFWIDPSDEVAGSVIESDVIIIANNEPEGAYRNLEGVNYLQITEESYNYILSIV